METDTTPDFKAALERLSAWPHLNQEEAYYLLKYHHNTIRTALLVADKVVQEPSDSLAVEPFDNKSRLKAVERKRVFKTMRDQLLKEIL
jgi:hypothetical protein